jgi:hypothetical protein
MNKILFEKIIVPQLGKKFLAFMKLEGSLLELKEAIVRSSVSTVGFAD